MLAHEELGDGATPVVFLHGLFARGRDLVPLAEAVRERLPHVRALMPDLPGHGASPDLPEEADLGTTARAVLSWLSGLGIEQRVAVVAHSMGGRIALRARELSPSRVGPLVLIDTPARELQSRRSPLAPFMKALLLAPERADDPAQLLAPLDKIMVGKGLLRWITAQIVEHPDGGYGWTFDRHAMAQWRWTTMGESLWSAVAELGPEQLTVIAPERSVYVRAEDREQYAGHGIEVVVQPKGTHDMHKAMPADKLALVCAALG
ncbi:MAG: alpha/beta hydrolase [Myxococcota bacterium]